MSLYDATLRPVVMPWWGWCALIAWCGAACRLAYDRFLDEKLALYHRYLSRITAMTIKHIGNCGCHPWERCKLHGDIEHRIKVDPEIEAIMADADMLATAKFAAKLEERTEAELLAEHREKEAQKRRMREAAAEDAKREAEERERRARENRDRLAKEAEAKRERARLAHAAEEAARAAGNGNKHALWQEHKSDILGAIGFRASSSPPEEGGS